MSPQSAKKQPREPHRYPTESTGTSEKELRQSCEALAAVCAQALQSDLTSTPQLPRVHPAAAGLQRTLEALFRVTRGRITDLHQHAAQHEAVLRSIGDGLYVVDRSYRITLMNPRARELLGLEGTHIIGRSLDEVVRMEDDAGAPIHNEKRPIAEALRARETITHSTTDRLYYLVNKRTGVRFPVMITVAPVIIKGETVAAVSLFRDSSAEVEVRRAKDEFISLASHQLRTPLSIIALNLEILDRYYADALTGDVRDHVQEIAHASRRMQRLVNSILNASRIEMGSIEPQLRTIDLSGVAQTVATENNKLFSEKNLQLVMRLPENPVSVVADTQLVEVVLDNLVSNAVKYSYAGTVVTIEITDLDSCAVVSVQNKGRGIPAYQRQRVFSKLFRADNAEEATEDGTGLGLYIARSLTEKMNGSIWFDSEHEGTTTFCVRFGKKEPGL